MYTLFSSLIVPDPDAFIEGSKSHSQEQLDAWGVVGQTIFRAADSNRVMIISTYETLEKAQQHKAEIESPEVEARMKQMGVQLPMDLWIAEEA